MQVEGWGGGGGVMEGGVTDGVPVSVHYYSRYELRVA